MNRLVLSLLCAVALPACGNSAAGNEAVGQVKKVIRQTPLICPDYTEVDVSLGVMRNGVGSMSKEDIELAIDPTDTAKLELLKHAAENGAIVKVSYDIQRVSWCWPDHRLTSAAIDTAEVQP